MAVGLGSSYAIGRLGDDLSGLGVAWMRVGDLRHRIIERSANDALQQSGDSMMARFARFITRPQLNYRRYAATSFLTEAE